MSPYAYDYGAGDAALFDIVNAPNLGRGAKLGAPTRSLPFQGRRREPLSIFQGLA